MGDPGGTCGTAGVTAGGTAGVTAGGTGTGGEPGPAAGGGEPARKTGGATKGLAEKKDLETWHFFVRLHTVCSWCFHISVFMF